MTAFVAGVALIVTGGAIALSRRAGPALAVLLAGCLLAAVDPVRVLAGADAMTLTIPASMPGGDWLLGIDALSAVFLLAILGVGGAAAVFGARHHDGGRFGQLAFAILLAAIALVVAARGVIVFLVAWEIMAIASYVLIVTHHEEAEVRRAGLIYLVATHTATLALFAMFATWGGGGAGPAADWSFPALAAASRDLGPRATAAILLLALFGFGFKAGCVPLHFWLPPAHAAAPSHVSALMSGIVIKTGIYGLLRVLLMLGGAPAWWGWLVLGIGAASAVLGVLWALAQHDVKRLLAYHSVENIGIILMGIGVGTLGVAHGSPVIAMLGFAGGLLHTVNHALFKSLLFLGAGAVYHATGTRNLEELGGLAKRMPLTWLGFVVGAAAIIGVPPFNGFVSEWLVFQAMFAAGQSKDLLRLAILGLPLLALTGGLALACFAKVAGVVFLGTARTSRAASAVEVERSVVVATLALAATCAVLGIVPMLGISLVRAPAAALAAAPLPGFPVVLPAIPDRVASGAWAISLAALVTLGLAAALWLLRARLMRGQTIRREATWGCGFDDVTPRMQYTASSFAAPLLQVFGGLSGVHEHRAPSSLRTHPIDLVLDGVALPLWELVHRAAVRLRAIQQGRGRLHVYLLFVMAALLAMLAYLAIGGTS